MKFLLLMLTLAVALCFCTYAAASTALDATKAAWYLKGEGDIILPTLGQVLVETKCHPTKTRYIVCTNRSVTPDYKQALCSRGRFYIKDFSLIGQFSRPSKCKAPPPA